MGVIVDQHGGTCAGTAAGAEICRQRLVFDAPAEPSAAEADAVAAPADEAVVPPPAPRAAPAEALEAAGGRRLDAARGARRDAGRRQRRPGRGRHGGGVLPRRPAGWLAARMQETPDAETSELGFAFSSQTVSSAARREDSAGGALIVELVDRPLVGLLSGRDSETTIAVDGAEQGVLSLRGSTWRSAARWRAAWRSDGPQHRGEARCISLRRLRWCSPG